jgi:hypothetical protein
MAITNKPKMIELMVAIVSGNRIIIIIKTKESKSLAKKLVSEEAQISFFFRPSAS